MWFSLFLHLYSSGFPNLISIWSKEITLPRSPWWIRSLYGARERFKYLLRVPFVQESPLNKDKVFSEALYTLNGTIPSKSQTNVAKRKMCYMINKRSNPIRPSVQRYIIQTIYVRYHQNVEWVKVGPWATQKTKRKLSTVCKSVRWPCLKTKLVRKPSIYNQFRPGRSQINLRPGTRHNPAWSNKHRLRPRGALTRWLVRPEEHSAGLA